MQDKYLGAMKLTTGEEIIGYFMEVEEDTIGGFHVLIKDPLKIEINMSSNKVKTIYTFSPWFILATDREQYIDSSRIMAMNTVDDDDVRREYIRYFNMIERASRPETSKYDPELGYIGSVKSTRKQLESLYQMESHVKDPIDPQ
jgi:hypothetical protein